MIPLLDTQPTDATTVPEHFFNFLAQTMARAPSILSGFHYLLVTIKLGRRLEKSQAVTINT